MPSLLATIKMKPPECGDPAAGGERMKDLVSQSHCTRKTLTYQEIIEHLQGPQPDGKGGVMAFCPCHNDGKTHSRRSLHVSPGRKDVALVYCFAGCNAVDILRALRGCRR